MFLSFTRRDRKVLWLGPLTVVTVLNSISLSIPAGKFTAVVGASGSGKSTIIQLLERFYDPVEGTISLDGNDIKSLNLRYLRGSMSLVSQEPVLFATTIYENVCHGYPST
jgi:ATP-binding cassette subfamily B (MDR/TAP) protein 1